MIIINPNQLYSWFPLPRLRVTLCEAGRPGMFHAKERLTRQTPTWGGYIVPANWPV